MNRLKNHLILIGPPGAGKSTVAEQLIQRLPMNVIATGKRLRKEIERGTPIGREIAPLLEQGHFAPESLMDRLMREWLAEMDDDRGFLLDGYPRSQHQAIALEAMLADLNRHLDLVVSLEISPEVVISRLSGRRICTGGGPSFTLHIDDAEAVQRCELRGGRLVQRDDDRPEVITERMEVYARETRPVLDYYRERGLVVPVDASGSPEQVAAAILALMERT